MTLFRPGGFQLTDRGVQLAKLGEGSRILDIGCGEGDTVAYLAEKYAMKTEGIEMSLPMINSAKEKHPGIDVKFGDGEFLDGYSSFTFDGIFMECVLSLIAIPDEALHEAFCVLKKGGHLIVSDLYYKDPDPKQMKAVKKEAERRSKLPHKEGDCEEHPDRYVDFRYEGAFYESPLRKQLDEIGYRVVAFEDKTDMLDTFVAEHIMNGGSMDDFITKARPKGKKKNRIGYFLMVAEKPL